MNHRPLRTSLLAAALLGAVTLPAAAAGSVDIEIVGIVPESCNIAIDNGRATLDLSGSLRQVRIATVTENCNRSGGYVVTVRSAQNGVLASSAGGIAYEITYGGEAVDLGDEEALERLGPDIAGTARDLLVTVPEGDYAEGVYRDVITIEISAQ